MKRLSITVRLTLLFILLLSVAGAGIVWTLGDAANLLI